ncbi:unnamed protein product [Effrenium voratum]|uniref:Protein kinase domain-containing protein n=1 Tax=Effrenium voratum TaxID=2562239 RepID=A0AA36J8K3_9DINO|nr:unnamed protein product [Effrenium voratum]
MACTGSDSSGSSGSESEARPRKLSPEERARAAEVLDKRLGKLSYLFTNHTIHKFFRRHARAKTSDGRPALTAKQAAEMAPELAEHLGVPPQVFRDVQILCQRFDFDGQGALDKQQCTVLFRGILRQKRKDLGPRRLEVEVPEMSLAEAGFTVERELGQGGQGVMYLCERDEVPFCIKFFSKQQDDDCLEDLLTEYTLMMDFSHINVAKTYEVFQDEEFFYLVNEPYFGGDLTKLAKKAHDQGLSMSEDWWRQIFRQCLEGLAYLHSKAVMHCDIKEENVMLATNDMDNPRVVLIDFGLAEALTSTSSGCSGTPGYIPPETWETEWWYPKGDIFSTGIMFFQLMIGQVPGDEVLGVLQTDGDRDEDMAAALKLHLPWERFPGEMPELRALVAQMTLRQLAQRPSAKGALEHEWFHSDSDEDLPAACRAALLGSSAAQCLREQVMYELALKNNLRELRALQQQLLEADGYRRGRLAPEVVQHYLEASQVRPGCVRDFVTCRSAGLVEYQSLLEQSLRLREQYSLQFLQDLSPDLGADEDGKLTRRQLETLLKSGVVECDDDEAEEMLEELVLDEEGQLSLGAFRAFLLQDGRIARRTAVEGRICEGECWRCQLL